MRYAALLLLTCAAALLGGCGDADDNDTGLTGIGGTAGAAGTGAGGQSGGASGGSAGASGGSAGTAGSGTEPYTEPLCDPLADLSELKAAYEPAKLRTTATDIAVRRYPVAVDFIEALSNEYLTAFIQDSSTFDGVLKGWEVAMHEGCHMWGFQHMSGGYSYRVRDDIIIKTKGLKNFARSEIASLHVNPTDDFYFQTYLTGSSGNQGFNTLLDEYNAYTHSLAAKYCTRDSLPSGTKTSARDGILTFMYYVELYLKKARTDHPEDYAEIVGDPEHVRLILTVWDRASFWLEVTEATPQLGIYDGKIRNWTFAEENLAEIELLRAK